MARFSNAVTSAATRAIFELQYGSSKATSFVMAEVPGTARQVAAEAVKTTAMTPTAA